MTDRRLGHSQPISPREALRDGVSLADETLATWRALLEDQPPASAVAAVIRDAITEQQAIRDYAAHNLARSEQAYL